MKKVSILLGGMALFASNSDAALKDLPGWGDGTPVSAARSVASRPVPLQDDSYSSLLQRYPGPGERAGVDRCPPLPGWGAPRGEHPREESEVIQSIIPLLNAVSALFQVLSDKIVVQPASAGEGLGLSVPPPLDAGAASAKPGAGETVAGKILGWIRDDATQLSFGTGLRWDQMFWNHLKQYVSEKGSSTFARKTPLEALQNVLDGLKILVFNRSLTPEFAKWRAELVQQAIGVVRNGGSL